MNRRQLIRLSLLIALLGAGYLVFRLATAAGGSMSPAEAEIARGRQLASIYCAQCHIQPAPEILPKRSWRTALGYMGYWLGMTDIDYLDVDPPLAKINVRSRHDIMIDEGVQPTTPLLREADWGAIREYYLSAAPESPLPQQDKPRIDWRLPQFRRVQPNYKLRGAVTTMVEIREEGQEVYIGDSRAKAISVLDGKGRYKRNPQRYTPPVFPIDIEFADDMAFIASIGDLTGELRSDDKRATVRAVPLVDGTLGDDPGEVIIDDLFRLAHLSVADLNGDGQPDFVTSDFGGLAGGGVSWHESQPDGSLVKHPLFTVPGAVTTATHDFDGDGRLDIMVLMGHAREGLHLLVNAGDGSFVDHEIFATHPSYGHTYFELQDFDADGRMDILVVNGDNVDSDPYNTPKNYHGLRIYLNRGELEFEEAWFYPMNGAFFAKAADFNGDGRLDIAAISFYPEYAKGDYFESFVYLENTGGLEFAAYSDPDLNKGRWMTMDVGDIDGDSDPDVVLGGSYLSIGMFTQDKKLEEFRRTGPAVVILENTLR